MRRVNFNYLRQAHKLLKNHNKAVSHRRLRRLAYLDVLQNNYKNYKLYDNYKKIMNSDASRNQTAAIIIVIALISAFLVFLII